MNSIYTQWKIVEANRIANLQKVILENEIVVSDDGCPEFLRPQIENILPTLRQKLYDILEKNEEIERDRHSPSAQEYMRTILYRDSFQS